jgi:ribosomal protein S18 acetylase RimI-like enzyme
MARSGDPHVRRFRRADASAVIAMLDGRDPWRRLGYKRQTWVRLLSQPLRGREGWVLDDGRAPIGFALVRRGFLLGDYLELFVVASGAVGRGVGQALLHAVESRVFARANNFFVCVSDFNAPARRFYRRLGYRSVGKLDDLLIAGSGEFLLRKSTGPARRDDPAKARRA